MQNNVTTRSSPQKKIHWLVPNFIFSLLVRICPCTYAMYAQLIWSHRIKRKLFFSQTSPMCLYIPLGLRRISEKFNPPHMFSFLFLLLFFFRKKKYIPMYNFCRFSCEQKKVFLQTFVICCFDHYVLGPINHRPYKKIIYNFKYILIFYLQGKKKKNNYSQYDY